MPCSASQLLVWPSTRFSWPSQCSLRCGRCSGAEGLCGGKRRSATLSGKQAPESRLTCKCKTSTGPSRRPGQPSTEIVADGWPLFHGAQLAVDTTVVSVLRLQHTRGRWSDECRSFLRQLAKAKSAVGSRLAGLSQTCEAFPRLCWLASTRAVALSLLEREAWGSDGETPSHVASAGCQRHRCSVSACLCLLTFS